MNLPVSEAIATKVKDAFAPLHLELHNESHMHAGPRTDSHFKLVLVSAAFEDLPKVKRHQLVYRQVADELAGPVHALALHLYTPDEWALVQVPDSPRCHHA
ncbi:MAG TPA: BolA family protein [Hyphomicrobiales bacterium]|nr:BolA family protein [Hyphomicrobiales bacterium]